MCERKRVNEREGDVREKERTTPSSCLTHALDPNQKWSRFPYAGKKKNSTTSHFICEVKFSEYFLGGYMLRKKRKNTRLNVVVNLKNF